MNIHRWYGQKRPFHELKLQVTIWGLLCTGFVVSAHEAASGAKALIADVSQLQHYEVAAVKEPTSVAELQEIIRTTQGPISVAGARGSQGGQIAATGGTVVDLKYLNAITIDAQKRRAFVQAGATWYQLQKKLDPLDLSVLAMQSYSDFTIGGSLSVNAHGRDIHAASVAPSVESIDILVADGSIVHASRDCHPELFTAALGGYGGMGIIVSATLRITENYPLERIGTKMPLSDYLEHFRSEVLNNPDAVIHSAYLYPPALRDVISLTFYRTVKPVTVPHRLRERQSWYPQLMVQNQLLQRMPLGRWLRQKIDQSLLMQPQVVWRNYEMSSAIGELELATRYFTTSVLQEYFIPAEHLEEFVTSLRDITRQWGVNLLNVSLRYVPQDKNTVLSYAPQDSFALVLYINMRNTAGGAHARAWTQALINAALACKGTYYLPYQLHATQHQFRQAYPNWHWYMDIKQVYDPAGRFTNKLIEKYLTHMPAMDSNK